VQANKQVACRSKGIEGESKRMAEVHPEKYISKLKKFYVLKMNSVYILYIILE